MSCSCAITIDHDGGPDVCTESLRVARKVHKCCECHREIKPGETYEHVRGLWDGYWSTYKTCADCKSVRDALFCSWSYETLWDDVRETLWQPPSSECMIALTKPARDKICDIVESYWDNLVKRTGMGNKEE